MIDYELALAEFTKEIGRKLNYQTLIPNDLFNALLDYIFRGNKNRSDYEMIVRYIFNNNAYYKQILLEV